MNMSKESWEEGLLSWVRSCESACQEESIPAGRIGYVPGRLEADRASLVEYVRDLLSDAGSQTNAARDVLAERRRQIEKEGWTSEHDDEHAEGLACAAACYAAGSRRLMIEGDMADIEVWPWDESWWKPTNRRRDLVKAGALILAEIERLDRAEAPKPALAHIDMHLRKSV